MLIGGIRCCSSCSVVQRPSILGTHLRIIDTVAGPRNMGLAVSLDASHMAVSHSNHTVSLYSLPGGEHVDTIGSMGEGPLQFNTPAMLCFTAINSILVAECVNQRVQEVTVSGEHVRFIGAGVIDDRIWSVATNDEVIVVGKCGHTTTDCNRLMLFDAATGAFIRGFGEYADGDVPSLVKFCNGVRFMPDNKHIVAAFSSEYPIMRVGKKATTCCVHPERRASASCNPVAFDNRSRCCGQGRERCGAG